MERNKCYNALINWWKINDNLSDESYFNEFKSYAYAYGENLAYYLATKPEVNPRTLIALSSLGELVFTILKASKDFDENIVDDFIEFYNKDKFTKKRDLTTNN